MPTIEFIYDHDCPNATVARGNLRAALVQEDLPAEWSEWERSAAGSPVYARAYGSPTILVEGRDVAGMTASDGAASCRIYEDPQGRLTGVPPVQLIRSALSGPSPERFRWGGLLATLPGFGASLLPVGLCPACWPAYAGVLGTLGLGSLLETAYLLPVTTVFFGLALFGLGYRARTRHGWWPLGLGTAGAVTAMAGKFALSWGAIMYLGLGLLLAASIWNSWPRRKSAAGPCASCAPQGLKSKSSA